MLKHESIEPRVVQYGFVLQAFRTGGPGIKVKINQQIKCFLLLFLVCASAFVQTSNCLLSSILLVTENGI